VKADTLCSTHRARSRRRRSSSSAASWARISTRRADGSSYQGLTPDTRYPDYGTFAVTDAFAFNVNVHVLVLFPPVEHAPDQIASRPLVTDSVIDVPTLNVADPIKPTDTLMPVGLDVTRSPLRPVALTVNVAVPVPPPPTAAGLTVSVAVRVSRR
jgi:hypothetical protein